MGRAHREAALASGRLERVRIGWFARPDAGPEVVTAVRRHGCLLVIECDGAEHLSSWQAQSADRERDRALSAAGYLVVRLTYRPIVHDWPRVEQDLLAIIRRGGHRLPRRTK